MRFDDSLNTVLAADTGGAGVRATWLQAVDLIGRRRAGPTEAAIARLRSIRDAVPIAVREASARGLERADPPAALVDLFADDEARVAAPVIRSARLTAGQWIALLPAMSPATRGVLRHRRDLDDAVRGALAAYGPDDLVLAPEGGRRASARSAGQPTMAKVPDEASEGDWHPPAPFIAPEPTSFQAVAQVARELPVVAEAIRRERSGEAPFTPGSDFEIAEIVSRIEAHQRVVESRGPQPAPAIAAPTTATFRFETDYQGVIRWCDTPERGPLIGLSLAAGGGGALVAADGCASGALARRTAIVDARLTVPGGSAVAGSWRISARPRFDHASGRFTGYLGTARRPRRDEEPRVAEGARQADALRQLVHELRTPANAISGFAEMIQHQLLGPVAATYRERATEILDQTAGLLGAIDDLDTAARVESKSLELRAEAVPLAPLLERVTGQLDALLALRGARLRLEVTPTIAAHADARMLERFFARLLTALVAKAAPHEVLVGTLHADGATIRGEWTRPAALTDVDGALFSADAELEAAAPGSPLLGGGFAFRLARRLAVELGGVLAIGPERLTLSLPAAVNREVEQATV